MHGTWLQKEASGGVGDEGGRNRDGEQLRAGTRDWIHLAGDSIQKHSYQIRLEPGRTEDGDEGAQAGMDGDEAS
jgi:hypothetical protein